MRSLAVAVLAAAAGWALARHAARPPGSVVAQPREPVVVDVAGLTDGELAEVIEAAFGGAASCRSFRAQRLCVTFAGLLRDRLAERDLDWLDLAARFGGLAWEEAPDDHRA